MKIRIRVEGGRNNKKEWGLVFVVVFVSIVVSFIVVGVDGGGFSLFYCYT